MALPHRVGRRWVVVGIQAAGGKRVFSPSHKCRMLLSPSLRRGQAMVDMRLRAEVKLRRVESLSLEQELRAMRVGDRTCKGQDTMTGWSGASTKLSGSSWSNGMGCCASTPPQLAVEQPQLGCPVPSRSPASS